MQGEEILNRKDYKHSFHKEYHP